MPLPGGATDKLGNRYEGRWTVSCLIDVMDEKAESIRLEKPGEDAFEFFLHRGNQLECHQVKRQKTGLGHWTLSALENNQVQVLSDFWRSLNDPNIRCVFVSTQDADQLNELTNHARNSVSWAEFDREFLKSKQQSTNFSRLCQLWGNCPPLEAYEALQRIHVETVSEGFLLNAVESRIAALVEGDATAIRLELAELALDKIHHNLTTHDIWHHLNERGFRRRQWGKDPHVLATVEAVNNSYLSSLQDIAIAGHTILRDEVQGALAQLTSIEGKRSVLLIGEAGVGKTGVTLQVVEQLCQQGFPILAFRIDNLNPEPMPDKIGQQLGLPGSPAVVLATIAQGRNCVLIIDQIDAVSLVSGRNPTFFDCIEKIIKQAQAYPNMRLLLVCRKFDLDNDSRFRKLTGEKGIADTFSVNRLNHAKVKEVVTEIGLDATRLTDKQLSLLSIPLHLSLLAEVAQNTNIDTLSFKTAKDLLEQFWKHKELRVKDRLGRAACWTQVIDLLCDRMSSKQSQELSVSENTVDDYADDARAMASEHVLAWEGKRIRFFHETFFDYAFARRFAARGYSVLTFLQSGEQHLFQRAQVRQILIHGREADFEQYISDLDTLLKNPDIRFHLKQVIFALLTSLLNPTAEEWRILESLIREPSDSLKQQVWRVLRSSDHWFELLDSLGIIEHWLQGADDELVEQAVSILSMIQGSAPQRVVKLVEPFIGRSEIWLTRLKKFIRLSELAGNRCLFEFFLRLIQEGICDQEEGIVNESEDFWLQIYSLKEKKPDWACEAIACYLDRWLNLAVTAQDPGLFDFNSDTFPQSRFDDSVLVEAAQAAPEAFVQHILPFMLRVLELTARREGKLPWIDSVWWFKSYGGGYNTEHQLLQCMEKALSSFAVKCPERFSVLASQQLYDSMFETIQYLLVHAYTANAPKFADEAAAYLCENPIRLRTGYSGSGNGNIHAAPHWATRQLLIAITPHCSEANLARLEDLLLNYYDRWEIYPNSDRNYLRACLKLYGYEQFVLLDAIEPSRRSALVNRRLQEWRRKFRAIGLLDASEEIKPPRAIEADFIDSPVPRQIVDRLSNAQWLKAIAHYRSDERSSWFERNGKWVGNARELASLLENQVKKQPSRFAVLAQQFPNDTNPCYFDAVLRGVAEVGVDIETAIQLVHRCHQLPNRPHGQSLSWLIGKLADLAWTPEEFEILIWYALHDPSPEHVTGGGLLTIGINTVKGSAATAIAKLLFADKNCASYFQEALEAMVKDPSIPVKACVAEALIALLNYGRDLAVNLFLELCNTENSLLGTRTVEQFVYYAIQTHSEILCPILERMITSDDPEVIEAGSRQACVASLNIEEAKPFAARCLSGTTAHQLGAAKIFVVNFRSAHFRAFCETALIQLFHADDETVRDQAARCFLHLKRDELNHYVELTNQFVQSPAFRRNSHDLIRALEETTASVPDLTYRVCDRYINNLKEKNTGNERVYLAADSVTPLLAKIYSQSTRNSRLQSQCLDLIDQLSEMEVYGLEKTFEQFER